MKRGGRETSPTKEGTCEAVVIDLQRVTAARERMPQAAVVQQVGDIFSLLADPTRLRILIALDGSELCVCDLSKVVGRSMAATSHQLQLLRRGHLVRYRMAGKLAYYNLADPWTRALLHDVLRRQAVAQDGPP